MMRLLVGSCLLYTTLGCGPGVMVADAGPEVILACEPGPDGCQPLGCGACRPGCTYPQAGCILTCQEGNSLVRDTQCKAPPENQACLYPGGSYRLRGSRQLRGTDGGLEWCYHLCSGSAYTPGQFTLDGRLCHPNQF